MTDLAMWSLIVGVLLPPLVAVIQQPTFPRWLRAVIMVVASAVAGAATAWFEGDFTGRSWVSSALLVGVSTIAAYNGFWKPTSIAPKIEDTTSPSINNP